jgi:hypothetical protein
LGPTTFVSASDWITYTANLGTYIFLIGALLQYVMIRIRIAISIPQTLTILIISRAISIILAWMIWFFYPKGMTYMLSEFVFVPAVISEVLILILSFLIVNYFKKKNG